MDKRVVIIASGETERRALPYLTAHLREDDIDVSVRIPARNRPLRVETVHKIMQSAMYDTPEGPPDKYVVLVDVDGKEPGGVLGDLQRNLTARLGGQFEPNVQYAYAQWHLEAWYFADAGNLKEYLDGRALGNVDTSQPDNIENPKLHLKHLLGERFYTARVSEDIARVLDASVMAQRSPSFHGFLEAVKNGGNSHG